MINFLSIENCTRTNEKGDKASLASPVVKPEMELWETTNSKGTKFNLVKSWQ